MVKPVDPKSHRDELTLLVRDFVVLERQLPANLLTSDLCPSGACSYIDTVVDGQRVAVNGTGVVVEYRFDTESDTFEETGGVLASLDFPVASAVATGNFALDVNGGYQPSDWARDDWFGVGLSVGYDQKYDRYVAAVGAPRDASGLYSFYLAKGAASQQWTAGQFLPNDDYYRRSFFGQKVQFAGDGRFLVVADPAGSGNSLGRGNVFLYYRRSTSEIMVPGRLKCGL